LPTVSINTTTFAVPSRTPGFTAVERSNPFHSHARRELRQCRDIVGIAGEHRSIGLGKGDEQSVDRGASPRLSPQERRSPGHMLGDFFDDIARLEQCVGVRIAGGVPLKAFDEDDGWNEGRPQIPLAQLEDQCGDLPRADSQARDAIRIEKQHAPSTGLAC
jgi:hypothetical protein